MKLLELKYQSRDADTERSKKFSSNGLNCPRAAALGELTAIAPRSPITSFGQAINLLGRRQLQRWLQLLVYADSGKWPAPNPLLLLAARRAVCLEILAAAFPPFPRSSTADAAFMAGTFSLLPVLLNLSMTEICPNYPAAAGRRCPGPPRRCARQTAQISDSADHGELAPAGSLVRERMPFPRTPWLSDQIEALTWAAKIARSPPRQSGWRTSDP